MNPDAPKAVDAADDPRRQGSTQIPMVCVTRPADTLAENAPRKRPADFAFLAPPQAPDEVGRLGGFRVLELLGEGGMGVVFRAEDPVLHRRIALKVMKPEVARHEQARQRFLREARAAAAVEHDHVVAVLQVGEDGDVPFLAMPLLKGESLEARLGREPCLAASEVLQVGYETALGLAAAHAAGLIHRDVKPSNLWLEPRPDGAAGVGRVKVLDFGLARMDESDKLTRTDDLLGTPGYMAPEQAVGGAVDARADLFGLGCVLYRLCAGRPPFEGKTLTAVLTQLATHTPPPPREVNSSVPAALSDLVMRLLSKDPSGRPASARATADALRTIADDAGAVEAAGRTPARPNRRRGWAWLAAAAGLLALAAGLAVWFWPRPTPPPARPDAAVADVGKGVLDVVVYDPDDPRRQNVRLNDPDVLPLKPGDRFAVEARMDAPAYLYIVWIDADGAVDPVYPWKPGHWEERPTQEQPVGRLRRPEAADHWFKIKESSPGMETLVLLARATPLPAGVDLKRELGDVRPQTMQTLQSTVWFENGAVVKKEPGRRPNWDEERVDDPVRETQERIRANLGALFPYSRAVSFAKRGT